MIQSWIMLPVLMLFESAVAMQTRSEDSWTMYILGILFILWGLWGRLAHGAAGAAFDAAELAPYTFAQSDRQLVGFGLITGAMALGLPCGIKDLFHRKGRADAHGGIME